MSDSNKRRAQLWLPALVCIGIIAGTIILWRTLVAQEAVNVKRLVQFKASQIGYDIQDQIEYRVNGLVRMAKRWEVRGRPLKSDWESDVSLYLTHYPGYQSMAWVSPSLKEEWSLTTKRGNPPHSGSLIQPLISGYLAKEAFKREVSLTGQLALTGDEKVFAAFVPVNSRKKTDGFLAGVFNINELFDSILLHETGGAYSIVISDGAENLYGHVDEADTSGGWSHELDIKLYNVKWHVKIWPNEVFLKELKSPLPGVILLAGFLMALLLSLVIYFARSAELRAVSAETSRAALEREVIERKRTEEEVKFHATAIEEANIKLEQEITDRKRAEQEVVRHAVELERSNSELEQFAYVASHDLQEPLRIVAGYVQLLSRRYRGRLDSDADEFIRYAVDGAARMQMLISDLLTYSRVGKVKDFAPVDCKAVFNRTIANLQKAIDENGATITENGLPTLIADASQLEHLFLNLVGNAIKYKSELPPVVHVSAIDKKTDWLFSVRDNGIGIDQKHFDRIFVIFQRLHGKAEYPGTGIGLSICKKVVENHGGRLWVESAPGQGTNFCFTIPKRREN